MWSTASREAPSSQPLLGLKDLSEEFYSDIVGGPLVGMVPAGAREARRGSEKTVDRGRWFLAWSAYTLNMPVGRQSHRWMSSTPSRARTSPSMTFPSEATLDRAHGPKPRSRSGTAGVLGLEYRRFWVTSVFLLTNFVDKLLTIVDFFSR